MINEINVCYDCWDRYIGCHGKCEKYIKEKEERDRQKLDIQKKKVEQSKITSTKIDGIYRMKTKRRKK